MGVVLACYIESPTRDNALVSLCTRALEAANPTHDSVGAYLKDKVFHSYELSSRLMRSTKPINMNTLSMFLSDHYSEFPKLMGKHD